MIFLSSRFLNIEIKDFSLQIALMSSKETSSTYNNRFATPCIPGNHKVVQRLPNGSCYLTATTNSDASNAQHKTYTSRRNIYDEKDHSVHNNESVYSPSKNYSTTSNIHRLSHFDLGSSCDISYARDRQSVCGSNTSSGICSLSDGSCDEHLSLSSEDLDFNLGFDQTSNDDETGVDLLDQMDQHEDEEEQNQNSNRNSGNRSN